MPLNSFREKSVQLAIYKPASLLVVSLGKALNGMPPSLCGRQMVGPSSLPIVVVQSDERHANRASAHMLE